VVFTPLYLVLRRRGVKFKFFHRVEELVPTADGRSIAAVRVGRQATLTPGAKPPPAGCPGLPPAAYEPLVPARGRPCAPSAPRYAQLAEGRELKQLAEQGYEPLESAWSKWPNREVIPLRAGEEFHHIILGIPVGSLRYLTPKLMEANPRWKAMVENVK